MEITGMSFKVDLSSIDLDLASLTENIDIPDRIEQQARWHHNYEVEADGDRSVVISMEPFTIEFDEEDIEQAFRDTISTWDTGDFPEPALCSMTKVFDVEDGELIAHYGTAAEAYRAYQYKADMESMRLSMLDLNTRLNRINTITHALNKLATQTAEEYSDDVRVVKSLREYADLLDKARYGDPEGWQAKEAMLADGTNNKALTFGLLKDEEAPVTEEVTA